MPSAAFTRWQTDRTSRLNEVDAHCAAVLALVPPNPTFLDEALRGFVLHLSAHFQGFCRDVYTECSQIWIAAIPPLVLSLCARLVPGAVPFFVPVKPAPEALPGESFKNAANAVARFGGGSFQGWAISECADFLLAEFCAVWFTTCGTLDITPKPAGEQTILFLPDCKMVYEGNPVTDRIQPKNGRLFRF